MSENEQKKSYNPIDPHSGSWRLQISSEHRLRSENLAFDIDVWYPILEKFTFKTIFLPFKRREAIAIIHYYQTRYIRNGPNSTPLLTLYDIKILNDLETEISKILTNKAYKFQQYGAFMRLCGRSPKDAEPLDREKIRNTYKENLTNLLNGNNAENIEYPNNGNTKLIAVANTQWLKISEAKDAMNQLLSSERVYTDLHDWIKYGEPEQIVFRVWCNDLSLDYEFRCFVYNNAITAISQYDHYAIYPYLKSQKQRIKQLLIEKWKEVHKYILQDHYCIDFGYYKTKDEVVLIEISPFRTCTGAACFNWKMDHDILFGVDDNKEIEFRLNEKSHPQIDDLVEANWELRWWTKTDPEPYWSLYDKVDKNWRERSDTKYDIMKDDDDDDRRIHYGILALISSILIGIVAVVWYYNSIWGIILAVIVLIGILFDGCYLYCSRDTYDVSNDVPTDLDDVERPLKYMEFNPNEGHLADIKQIDKRVNNQMYVLFVYGTLKRNFHWNHKFMSRGSKFIGKSKTVDKFLLIMGDCNVPYVLDIESDRKENEMGKNILGELWHIDYETLIGLDDYEGCNKGHYKRKKIDIIMIDENKEEGKSEELIKANIYMKADVGNVDFSKSGLNEYDYEYHKKYYSPIKHIQVKQLAYLGEDFSRT
eukprot:536633_1